MTSVAEGEAIAWIPGAGAVIVTTLFAVVFLGGPMAVLVVLGVLHARRRPGPLGVAPVVLAGISTLGWLVFAGLYPHESPCGLAVTDCPSVYGTQPLFGEANGVGMVLVVAVFVLPAFWVGWGNRMPALTAGAALAVGPTAVAWWTIPRGDDDGLWALIFLYLPALGFFAAGIVAVIGLVVSAHRRRSDDTEVLVPAGPAENVGAVVFDVAVVGVVLMVPLTMLSHAHHEVVALVVGVGVACAYFAVPLRRAGRTFGQLLLGLWVLDSSSGERPSVAQAVARSMVLVVEVVAVVTMIGAVFVLVEVVALIRSGVTVTDRVLGTTVVARRNTTTVFSPLPPPPAASPRHVSPP